MCVCVCVCVCEDEWGAWRKNDHKDAMCTFVIILILMFTLELEFWARGIMNCWYVKIIPESGYIVILDIYDVRMYLLLLFYLILWENNFTLRFMFFVEANLTMS